MEYRLCVVLLELRCLKIFADPFIDPVAGLPGRYAGHKTNVSTGFAELQSHTGAQFIILRDGSRRHERIIQCVQNQSGSFDVSYKGTATGTSIVIIDAAKAV